MTLSPERRQSRRELIDVIIADMASDVAEFDGKPLTGRTVAEIHGTLAATIVGLAKVVGSMLDEQETS